MICSSFGSRPRMLDVPRSFRVLLSMILEAELPMADVTVSVSLSVDVSESL